VIIGRNRDTADEAPPKDFRRSVAAIRGLSGASHPVPTHADHVAPMKNYTKGLPLPSNAKSSSGWRPNDRDELVGAPKMAYDSEEPKFKDRYACVVTFDALDPSSHAAPLRTLLRFDGRADCHRDSAQQLQNDL
jgi:hypothetical protein